MYVIEWTMTLHDFDVTYNDTQTGSITSRVIYSYTPTSLLVLSVLCFMSF